MIQSCDEIKVTTVQFSRVSWSSGRDLYSQLQEPWKRSIKYLLFRVWCWCFFIHHRIQGQISTQRERSFSFFINLSVYSDKYNQSLLFSYCTGSAVWKLGTSFKCKSVRNKKDSIYGSVLKYYYIITHILNHKMKSPKFFLHRLNNRAHFPSVHRRNNPSGTLRLHEKRL